MIRAGSRCSSPGFVSVSYPSGAHNHCSLTAESCPEPVDTKRGERENAALKYLPLMRLDF